MMGTRPRSGPRLIAQTRLPCCSHDAPHAEHEASCRRGWTRMRMRIEKHTGQRGIRPPSPGQGAYRETVGGILGGSGRAVNLGRSVTVSVSSSPSVVRPPA
jgi:hypothetical protein